LSLLFYLFLSHTRTFTHKPTIIMLKKTFSMYIFCVCVYVCVCACVSLGGACAHKVSRPFGCLPSVFACECVCVCVCVCPFLLQGAGLALVVGGGLCVCVCVCMSRKKKSGK
jgi:hypothetical protein